MEIGVGWILLLVAFSLGAGYLLSLITKKLKKERRLFSLISGFSSIFTIVWSFLGTGLEYWKIVMLTLSFTGVLFSGVTLASAIKKV